MLLQKTISVPLWAASVPDEAAALARERRFRRWLNTPFVQVRRYYTPFIRRALADWEGHTLYVGHHQC